MFKYQKRSLEVLMGLAIMIGILLGSFADARADAGTPGFTPGKTNYAQKCTPVTTNYGAKVDFMTDPYAGGILSRYAFVNTGTPKNVEVWILLKYVQNDPSTWRYWNCSTPTAPNNKYGTISVTPKVAFTGTLASNSTVHCLMAIQNMTPQMPAQVCFIFDKTVNGVVNLDCIHTAPGF